MSSTQIRALLSPPDAQISHQKTLAVLNEQCNSLDDLDELDRLVQQTQELSNTLSSQLSISQSNVDKLVADTRATAEAHLHSAQELSLLRHSLTDELAYLSQELVSAMSESETGPTLLEDVESLHRSLKELESVKGYVQIIDHALKLSELAVEQIRASKDAVAEPSLTEYKSLQTFVSTVASNCAQVADASGQQTLSLVTFLEKTREKTWADMKGVLIGNLLSAAEKLKWPMPVDYIVATPEERKAFEAAFLNLLNLQQLGEKIRPTPTERSEKDGLYPIQALVQPVSLRFKYHFEGTRETNRIDKPEWYFTHVLNVTHEHRSFMENVVQHLLASTKYRNIMAWREFTMLLIPLLSRKLTRTVPTLLNRPSLLAHTIYQALAFDAAITEDGFSLAGTSAAGPGDIQDKWDGTSDIVLGKKEWFDAWMEGEKLFAEDQYNELISAPDAWLIVEDAEAESSEHDMRSTNSARRLKALVEQVTDRYSPLPHFTHRTRFLISVQLPLLEQYHARISSSLDAFESLSAAFVRAVPGALGVAIGGGAEGSVRVDTGRLTAGIEGVQRLCKALVSARFMEAAMDSWGEELFFLELWTEINQRASLRARAQAESSLPDPSPIEEEAPESTIFEELVLQYAKLAVRAEDIIVQQVCGEVEQGLKAHFSAPQSDAQQADDIALSPSLLGPIALLSSHLTFLRSTLPPLTVAALYRRIASRLSEHIFHRQILYRGRHRISVPQGRTICAECELWVETCQSVLSGSSSRPRVEAPWLRLLEGGRLVAVQGEAWDKLLTATFGMGNDSDWEELVDGTVGICEMNREEVQQILRTREDCGR
ncbi:hypothetical protein HWV62_44393 [Athelia sp. TMB]|nr:hypothetical protein HWV62_44393 [Athelia sp. TMB]